MIWMTASAVSASRSRSAPGNARKNSRATGERGEKDGGTPGLEGQSDFRCGPRPFDTTGDHNVAAQHIHGVPSVTEAR